MHSMKKLKYFLFVRENIVVTVTKNEMPSYLYQFFSNGTVLYYCSCHFLIKQFQNAICSSQTYKAFTIFY